MTSTTTYQVRYTENIVRDAVRTYLWRRGIAGQKLLWTLEILMIAVLAFLLVNGDRDWVVGALAVGALLPPIFLLTMWLAHYRNTVGQFHRMSTPTAEIALREDGLDIRSELGASRLAWSAFMEIWERPGYWILFMGPGQFMTFPTAALPDDALAFVRARIGAAPARPV
ncbi:hypothetical protein CAL29_07120 [Bordetella genomosp. 10]|uniref:YcxB-like C-terminal domain-containing protein n=1 Tax=Bordetella genomosp. 10 TaxID=1416804 RepID=A0A261SMA1_9BORD|nr:YcxB family protein [Bordetella genomosp. 10]OZI38107.1 hypothetical protein CAL29_07120 [Bordetella genomosp. 10]